MTFLTIDRDKKPLVILESPYAGKSKWPIINWFQRRANIRYARACVRDSLSRGECPIASHLLYTQPGILDDNDPTERQWGIDAGLAWGDVATKSVFYLDRGWSRGMQYGLENAKKVGRPTQPRSIADISGRGWYENIFRFR